MHHREAWGETAFRTIKLLNLELDTANLMCMCHPRGARLCVQATCAAGTITC